MKGLIDFYHTLTLHEKVTFWIVFYLVYIQPWLMGGCRSARKIRQELDHMKWRAEHGIDPFMGPGRRRRICDNQR